MSFFGCRIFHIAKNNFELFFVGFMILRFLGAKERRLVKIIGNYWGFNIKYYLKIQTT